MIQSEDEDSVALVDGGVISDFQSARCPECGSAVNWQCYAMGSVECSNGRLATRTASQGVATCEWPGLTLERLEAVAPHTHRSSIRITMLRGRVLHSTFEEDPPLDEFLAFSSKPADPPMEVIGKLHTYRSVLLGGAGRVETIVREPRLSTVVLRHNQLHTMTWSADAIWLVDEGPKQVDTTTVFLRDRVDRFVTDGLYEPMSDDEYAENADLVWRLAAERNLI